MTWYQTQNKLYKFDTFSDADNRVPMPHPSNNKMYISIEMLLRLFDQPTILCVGSGQLSGYLAEREEHFQALYLMEADSGRARKVESQYAQSDTIHVQQLLVADSVGMLPFYKTTLESENGLIAPQFLKPIWKNIECVENIEIQAETIFSLMKKFSSKKGTPVQFSWIIIDCLSAHRILTGADCVIDSVDVCFVRVTAEEYGQDNNLGPASRASLERSGVLSNFVLLQTFETNNAAINYILYVKNWKQYLNQHIGTVQAAFDVEKETNAKLKVQLNRELDVHKKEAYRAQQDIEQLSNQVEDLKRERDMAQDANQMAEKKLKLALEENEKHSVDLRAKLSDVQGQLNRELDVHKKEAYRAQQDIEQLSNQVEDLKRERDVAQDANQMAEKKQRLADSNLEDMRQQFRALSERRLGDQQKLENLQLRLEGLVKKVLVNKTISPVLDAKKTGNSPRKRPVKGDKI